MFSEPHRKTKYFLQPHRIAMVHSLLLANDWSGAKSIILNYQQLRLEKKKLCSLFGEGETWGEGNCIFLPREIFIFRQWIKFQVSCRNKINPIWKEKVLCSIGEITAGTWYYLSVAGVFSVILCWQLLKKTPQLRAFFSSLCDHVSRSTNVKFNFYSEMKLVWKLVVLSFH